MESYRSARRAGADITSDMLGPSQWARFVRVVPGQTAASSTFQMAVVVLCDSTTFTHAPFRHLVWVTRARHLTLILAPPAMDIPLSCPVAWDLFWVMHELGWMLDQVPWGRPGPTAFASDVFNRIQQMANPNRHELLQRLRDMRM